MLSGGQNRENKMTVNSCCQNCVKRHIGCHARCELYQKWRKELDELNACIRKERMKDDYVIDAKRESLHKQANHYKNLGFRNPTNK